MQEEIKNKAIFQFQGELMRLLKPLERYGQQAYVEMVVPEIVKIARQMLERVEGKDVPILAKTLTYTP